MRLARSGLQQNLRNHARPLNGWCRSSCSHRRNKRERRAAFLGCWRRGTKSALSTATPERRVNEDVHLFHPRIYRHRRRLKVTEAMVLDVGDGLADPLHRVLDDDGNVRERCLRTRDHEQVREAVDSDPEISLGAAGPSVTQSLSVPAMNVHDPQCARPRIKPGGEDQHVELVLVGFGAHTLGRDPTNRRLTDIDEPDVVPVERFVVRVTKRRALGSERIPFGQRSSAVTGSLTISRILFRRNSAAASFDSSSTSRSSNVSKRNWKPPVRQPASRICCCSSAVTSDRVRFAGSMANPKRCLCAFAQMRS